MKTIFYFSLLAMLFIIPSSFAAEPNYPKLFFSYSGLYDEVCAGNNPVTASWADEARNRESEFTAIWEQTGPTLLSRLVRDFGKGFERRELSATLSVCHGGGSFSVPLVIDVSLFLKSYMEEQPVKPNFVFVDMVFHELIHNWLIDNFKFSSPLLTKYKNEPKSVRSHMHLMALQKFIYIELGKTDMLRWITNLYPKTNGPYSRAWQIVNTEGYEAFIAEIKYSNESRAEADTQVHSP